MSALDPMERLRTATADVHARTEKQLNLMRPDVTAEDYGLTLERFLSFFRPFEAAVRESAATSELPYTFGLPSRLRKADWLAADLVALGRHPGDVASQTLPADLLSSLDELIGALYVVEGSTLGGQVITKHLQAKLKPIPEMRFFASYGTETGRYWRGFQALVAEHLETEDQITRAEEAAKRTFALISATWSTELCSTTKPSPR